VLAQTDMIFRGRDVLTKGSWVIRGSSLFLTLNVTAKCVLLVNREVLSGMHIVAETTADFSCVRSKRQVVLPTYSLGKIDCHILSMTHLL
jgi:hypothetical protein